MLIELGSCQNKTTGNLTIIGPNTGNITGGSITDCTTGNVGGRRRRRQELEELVWLSGRQQQQLQDLVMLEGPLGTVRVPSSALAPETANALSAIDGSLQELGL